MAKKKTTGRKTAARGRKQPAAARKKGPRRKVTKKRATRRKPTPKSKSKLATAATAVRGAVAGAVAAVAERMPWTTSETDALAFLEKDHRRFEQLLKQGEETTEHAVKRRTQLLDTIVTELTLHELIEEKVLYPALKLHPEAKDIVLESFQEHHVADVIVRELQGLDVSDERWGAKLKVLKENLEHHIQEEEGPMWRTARGVFSQHELQQLGARMARMKSEARSSQ